MAQTKDSGDKGQSPPQEATVESRFAALLEIGDNPPDPQTPPDADDESAGGDDAAGDEDVQDDLASDDLQGDDAADSSADDDDEEAGSDDAQDDAEDELVFTVTVDGQQQDVDAAELVAGYQRQSDYSRKTAKLAEERKSFDSERQAVQQERARYASLLDKLEATIEAGMPQEPDWAKMRAEHPQEYALRRAEWQEQKEKLQQVQAERQRTLEKQREEHMRALQKHVEGERERLVAAIPEWKDQAAMTEGTRALNTYAVSVGFSEEELAQVVDHRAVLLLRKAMLYDQLQGSKPVVRKKAKGAPTIKPGAKPRPKPKADKSQRAREQLKKDGSITAATDAFLAMLE